MPNSNSIALSLPEANKTDQYQALGGKVFEFLFDLDQADITRDQNNMIISGAGKGSIELLDLYTPGATDTPSFILQNGTSMDTPEFIATYDPPAPVTPSGDEPGILSDPVPHPAIEFKVPENVGESTEVSLQQGYTVDTTGWTKNGDLYSLNVTINEGLPGEQVIGRFVYQEGQGLSFVLDQAVPHENSNEFILQTNLWLMDPDENLVRPEVEINIEANASDFPNLGSDFYIGSPGATSPLHCEGQNYGTWPVPNDPTQYELTFDVELAGYPALKGIKLDFSSSYESVHTVYLDGQVDENGEIIQGNIPFFTITFYDDGAYQINFLSQYRPALGQSTPPITGDLKLTINATDPVNDNTSSLSTERELMFRDSQLNLGAIKADTPANEEDLRGLGAGDPLPEITLYDSSQTSNRLYGWKILTSKAEASAAGADLEITDWTRSADTTPEGYEIWTLDLGADAHGTLTMYRDPSGTQGELVKLFYTFERAADHRDASTTTLYDGMVVDNLPIAIIPDPSAPDLGGSWVRPTYGYPLPISVIVPIEDADPAVQFAAVTDPVIAGRDNVLDLALDFGPDQAADANAYELTIISQTSKEHLTLNLTVGVKETVTFHLADGTSYTVDVTLQDDGSGQAKLVFHPSEDQTDQVHYQLMMTITDKDGDKASSTTELFNGEPQQLAIDLGPVQEAGLGNDVGSGQFVPGVEETVTQEAALSGGWKLDTSVDLNGVSWVEAPAGSGQWTLAEASGTYSYNEATGKLSYTLERAFDHDDGDGQNTFDLKNNFTFYLEADPTHSITQEVKVTIYDDIPDFAWGPLVTTDLYAGEPIHGEISKLHFGADGLSSADDAIQVTIAFTSKAGTSYTGTENVTLGGPAVTVTGPGGELIGTFALNADGTGYTFTPANATAGSASISLTITDGDMDPVSGPAPMVIEYEVRQSGDSIVIPGVNESNLPGGSSENPIPGDLSQTADLPDGWSVDTDDPTYTWVPSTEHPGSFELQNPDGAPGKIIYTPPSGGDPGSLTFELEGPYTHPDGNGKNTSDFSLPDLPIKHEAGSTDTIDVEFSITDDIPEPSLVTPGTEATSGMPYEMDYDPNYGADGKGAPDELTFTVTPEKGQPITGSVEIDPSATDPQPLLGPDGTEYGTIHYVPTDPTKPDDGGKLVFVPAPDSDYKIGFDIKVEDTDGDEGRASTPSEITVKNEDSPDPIDVSVDESALPGGTGGGFGSASQLIAIPADYIVNTAGWDDTSVPGALVKAVDYGRLVYTPGTSGAAGTLVYELTETYTHPDANSRDQVVLTITGGLPLTHAVSGNSHNVDINLTIVDDIPAPSLSTPGNEATSGMPYEMGYDPHYGADGKGASDEFSFTITPNGGQPVTGSVQIDPTTTQPQPLLGPDGTEYGTIQHDATTGKLTFVPAPDSEYTIDFEIRVVDTDDDSATVSNPSSITVKKEDSPDPVEVSVDESAVTDLNGTGLGNGSASQSIAIPADYVVNTAGWDDTIVSGSLVKEVDYGRLVYTPGSGGAAGTLVYELTEAYSHPDPDSRDSSQITISGGLPLTHVASGNSHNVDIKVTILDDIPNPLLSAEDPNQTPESGVPYVIDIDPNYGADGPGTGDFELVFEVGGLRVPTPVSLSDIPTDLVLNGVTYGSAWIDTTGKLQLTFKPAPDMEYDIKLWVSATDGDGDRGLGQAPLELTVEKPNITVPVVTHEGEVDEAFIVDPNGGLIGSGVGTGTDVQEVLVPNGFRVNAEHPSWVDTGSGTKEITLAHGKLVYDTATGKVEYVLTDPFDHPDGTGADLAVVQDGTIPLTHIDTGNSYDGQFQANIRDDIPVSNIDDATGFAGDLIVEDFHFAHGADGAPQTGDPVELTFIDPDDANKTMGPIAAVIDQEVTVEIDGKTYGTFKLRADGKYEFKAADPKDADSFDVRLTVYDADGDSVSSEATVSYMENFTELPFDSRDPFDEAYLPDGTLAYDPASADPDPLTKEVPLASGWTPDLDPAVWTQVGGGTEYHMQHPDGMGYFTFDTSNPGILKFTLNANTDHPLPGRDDLDISTTMKFVHPQSPNGSDVKVTLTIRDDEPITSAVTPDVSIDENSPSVIQGELTIIMGADQVNDPNLPDPDAAIIFTVKGTYNGPNGPVDTGWPDYVILEKDGTPYTFETKYGNWTLTYDDQAKAGEPNVKYTYEPKLGLAGASEQLSFSLTDSDKDSASGYVNMNFKDTFTGGFGFVVDEAAIPGLGSGQHFLFGKNASSATLDPDLILTDATSINWLQPDTDDIIQGLRADANGDGTYGPISWVQVGNDFLGYAEGEVAIRIQPVMDANGVFTGQITTTLNLPVQHTYPKDATATDLHTELQFALKFTQSNDTGFTTGVIKAPVKVIDDEPMRDYRTDANGNDTAIVIDLNGQMVHHTESVYITLDTACSMSYSEGQKAVAAIKALAQSYIDNGIDAVFTLTGFHNHATTYYNHVSAEQLIKNLNWSSIHQGKYSNFDVGLAETMRMMEIGRNSSEYNYRDQTLYFLSDGCACKCQSTMKDWSAYMASRGDSLDVNVINVDDCKPNAAKLAYLMKVAGDPANYYQYGDYSELLDQFEDLVHTESAGSLLGNILSADGIDLVSIEVDGNAPHVFATQGDFVYEQNGVTIVIKADGSYTVKSGKLDDDVLKQFTLNVTDNDQDVYSIPVNLVLTDATRAFDNVGVTSPYGVIDPLVSFGCAATNVVTGCYRYTCFTGKYMPGIEDYSNTLLGCKGYAVLLCANKCVKGDDILRNIVGGESEVQKLFDEVGIIENVFGANSIMQFDVTDSGGAIEFNWAFKAGNTRGGLDSAFYFVKNSAGEIVDSGLMSQGKGCTWDQGVVKANLPNYYDTYTLYIVQQEMGTCSRSPDSCLFLKDVVYRGDDNLRAVGNVISDPSPDGQVDNYHGTALLSFIQLYNDDGTLNPTKLYFGSNGKLEVQTDDGWLYVDNKGGYTFVANDGLTGDVVADFKYTLVDSRGEEVHADLHIRSDDHIVNGTDGDDTIRSGGENDLIQAGGGDDVVIGSQYGEVIYGGSGDDTIRGEGGNDVIHGGKGNDSIDGGAGNDRIYGGDGNDVIYGGDGDDLIYGGSGINFLNGGAGNDTFAWDKFSIGGRDIISDFTIGEDKLQFDDLLTSNLVDFQFNKDQTGILFTIDHVLGGNSDYDLLNKVVEVRFTQDNAFTDLVANYNDPTSNDYQDNSIIEAFIKSLI